jgi:hypothetical protein
MRGVRKKKRTLMGSDPCRAELVCRAPPGAPRTPAPAPTDEMPTRVLLCAGTTGQYLAHSDDNVLELHPHTGDVSPAQYAQFSVRFLVPTQSGACWCIMIVITARGSCTRWQWRGADAAALAHI